MKNFRSFIITAFIMLIMATNSCYETEDADSPPGVSPPVDDSKFIWSLSGDTTVFEGHNANYTITLSGDTLKAGENANIQVNTLDGTGITAFEGVDYTSIDGTTITITGPSSSATFTVSTITDLIKEGNEAYRVELSNPSSGTISSGQNSVQTTIIDN